MKVALDGIPTAANPSSTKRAKAKHDATRTAFQDVSNRNSIVGSKNGKNAGVAKKGTKTTSSCSSLQKVASTAQDKQRGAFVNENFSEPKNVYRTCPTDEYNQQNPKETSLLASKSYQFTAPADDIDARDAGDPLQVTAYVHDMYEYFREQEKREHYGPYYMLFQPSINERMRGILVDWLAFIHPKFKLVHNTLYISVALIDRYLSNEEATKKNLQLVGVTALLIASKYEEIHPVDLLDLVHVCDNAYDAEEILEMETKMLETLDYHITFPTAHVFLTRYLNAGHADKTITYLSYFILDETLLCYDLLKYLPSELAAATVYIARKAVGRNGWSPTLLKYADYSEENIIPIARAIMDARESIPSNHTASKEKYASSKFKRVSKLTIPTI